MNFKISCEWWNCRGCISGIFCSNHAEDHVKGEDDRYEEQQKNGDEDLKKKLTGRRFSRYNVEMLWYHDAVE